MKADLRISQELVTTQGRAVKAVLLDLDGTLIATRKLYLSAYSAALAPYVGRQLSEAEIISLDPRAETEFVLRIVGAADAPACLESFYERYEALHAGAFEGVYEGISEALGALRRCGIALGVVTGKSRRGWSLTSMRAPFPEVQSWVFGDETRQTKPSPEGIRLCLQRLSAEPSAALYVGDSVSDLQAAHAAGVRPVAALWSKRAEEREEFAAASRRFGGAALDRPGEIIGLLGT